MITMRSRGSVLLALTAVATVHPRPCLGQADPERLLRRVADASAVELANLAAGESFVKTLETRDRRELTQVYAVRVGAPVDFLLDQIRIGHLLLDDAEGAPARGFFGTPPRESDLETLSLSRSAIRALEACQPQDCDLKLPAEAIERISREVDWSSRTATEDANRYFRRTLLSILAAYMAHGDAAGLIYGDKPDPLDVGEGFEQLLRDAKEIQSVDAPFARYLGGYPDARLSDVEDMFTWTIEDLGMKSLVSLNHIAFKTARSGSGVSIIGVKRLYSSHYFQAGLRVIIVSPASGDPSIADSYVMVVDRRRFDGELGGLRRIVTERRLERRAEAVMASTKALVETEYAR